MISLLLLYLLVYKWTHMDNRPLKKNAIDFVMNEGYIAINVISIQILNKLYSTVKVCTFFSSRDNFPHLNRWQFFKFVCTVPMYSLRCVMAKSTSHPVSHFRTVRRAILPVSKLAFIENSLTTCITMSSEKKYTYFSLNSVRVFIR